MKKFFVSIVLVSILLLSTSAIWAMKSYEEVDFVTGMVTASALNVRTGPSLNYRVIGTVYKNEYIRVFAKIGDWYVVQTPSDQIGAVSTKYVKAIKGNSNVTSEDTSTPKEPEIAASSEEIELLKLINKERVNNGLPELKFDAELQKVATIKAKDLVENNYFSHNSPVYGSPFEMMKSFGITYKAAGENIARKSFS